MNQKTLELFIGDFFIVLAFALSPGIRGYDDWKIYEYVLWVFLAAVVIYERHKKIHQSDPK